MTSPLVYIFYFLTQQFPFFIINKNFKRRFSMSTKDFLILLISSTAFGTIMGAYFGTIQYRITTDEPFVTSHCFCPNCKNTLSLWFQIPILSWFFLRGKCYYCKKPIPIKYPLIESSFLVFYLTTFLLFYKNPFLLVCIWILFIIGILLLNCKKHFRSAIKAFFIFLIYHLIYGGLLIILSFALTA